MTDDDLRARMRDADPAAALAPAAPDRITRLVEDTMTTATVATRPRTAVLAAAAALVLIAAAAAGWVLLRPRSDSAGPGTVIAAPSEPAPAPTVRLSAPAVRAKCMEPTAAALTSAADFAFAGTVTGVAGDVVTLRVSRVYRGAAAGTVEVAQQGDTSETLMGSGRFETGRDYLVASSRGTVLICGYSGEADAQGLAALYGRAFG